MEQAVLWVATVDGVEVADGWLECADCGAVKLVVGCFDGADDGDSDRDCERE